MRIWLAAVLLLVVATAPAKAQELARVQRTAVVRMPEFMSLQARGIVEEQRTDGVNVKKVLLSVSANRSWRLQVEPSCDSDCKLPEYRVINGQGASAHQKLVVVEVFWRAGEKPPAVEKFAYSLVAI